MTLTNGREQPATEWLREMLRLETEGATTPAQSEALRMEQEEQAALEQMASESGIRRVEQLLEGEMSRRVLTLTPSMWREMSAVEQRVMLDWTERRVKLLSERLCFQRNNIGSEPDVPEMYRVGAL